MRDEPPDRRVRVLVDADRRVRVRVRCGGCAMSGREWQPGELGVNVAHGYKGIFIESCRMPEHSRNGGPCWHNESGLSDPPDDIRRPLVVIDPEDREQVERLGKTFHESDHLAPWHDLHTRATICDAMQAALRSLITPPRPEEPTGLGAVVEDADGRKWVRDVEGDDIAGEWYRRGVTKPTHYVDITAVRVLSEGVTA